MISISNFKWGPSLWSWKWFWGFYWAGPKTQNLLLRFPHFKWSIELQIAKTIRVILIIWNENGFWD